MSKHIPPKMRINVWNTYEGNQNKIGTCMCCNSHITFENYHCGHIIAEKNGGDKTVENLRPVCSNCNLSMQTMNMIDFIKANKLKLNPNFSGYKGNEETSDGLKVDELKIICSHLNISKTGAKNLLLQKIMETTRKTTIRDILSVITCDVLKQLCDGRKLSKSGTRENLVDRLCDSIDPNNNNQNYELEKKTNEISEMLKNKNQPKLQVKDKLLVLQIFNVKIDNKKNISKTYETLFDESFKYKNARDNIINQHKILKLLNEKEITDIYETLCKKNKKLSLIEMNEKISENKLFYSNYVIKKLSKMKIVLIKKICDIAGIEQTKKKDDMIFPLIVKLFDNQIDKIKIENIIDDKVLELNKDLSDEITECSNEGKSECADILDEDIQNECDDENSEKNNKVNEIDMKITKLFDNSEITINIKKFVFNNDEFEVCDDNLYMNKKIIDENLYVETYFKMINELKTKLEMVYTNYKNV